MRHVYWVWERELAGRSGPECFAWRERDLAAGGIGAIISLDGGGVEPDLIADAGIKHLPAYRPMVMLDTERDQREFLAVMPMIAHFIDTCRQEQRPVMVHCHYGCDRTGTVLGAYLIGRFGMTPKQAFNRIRQVNPAAYGASGYAEALLTFDKMVKENPGWL